MEEQTLFVEKLVGELNRSTYIKKRVESFIMIGIAIILLSIVYYGIESSEPMGIFLSLIGVLLIGVAISSTIQAHRRVSPQKWYYSPKAALKRAVTKNLGLF